MSTTPPVSPSRPIDALVSDRHDGSTQRLGVLMEKYTQPEGIGEHGDPPSRAWQSQRALTPIPAFQAADPSPATPSLVEASNQLSRWLAGYFTDPMCGLKGVVMVSLFEALDEVCMDVEPWDGEGEAPDLFVVRGMMSGGVMDGVGWETGEAWEGEMEDLASLDEELRASYPAVYGIRHTSDAGGTEDGCGFPSVSVGPGATGPGGREEDTCEQVGEGQPEGSEPAPAMQLLEVVDDRPGWVASVDPDGENGGGCKLDVSLTPVGGATAAAAGELLRLGDVFATEGSICDRNLRDAADHVARRLRKGTESGSGQGEKDTQKEEGMEEDSEIVPNSQEEEEEEEEERPPSNEQQRLPKAPNVVGFAVPPAKEPRDAPIKTNIGKDTNKGSAPSDPNDYNPESDPYLLSGLHATADCLAMVQPTAREDLATEPWMTVPNLNVGGGNRVVCQPNKAGRTAQDIGKHTAQGRRGVRRAAIKAKTTRGHRQQDVENDETEAKEESMSEYSDTACPDEISEEIEDDDEQGGQREPDEEEDGDVQVRNRPHRMIATCPPESQASAEESPDLTARAKSNAKNKRKSRRLAAQRDNQDQAADPEMPQRKRRSIRRSEKPNNNNTEDMLIGDYVKEQRKVGCSKCRYVGCRACRGYTLKELAQKKGVLHGISFMISRDGNIVGTKAQAELVKIIEAMGGRVLASLSDLLELVQGKAKPKPNRVNAVLVTSNATNRTLKCIAARVIGLPMISPGWIADCVEKKRLGGFTARTAHVLAGKGCLRPSGPLLEQLKVKLVLEKPSANAQDIAALIKLLGGVPGCFDAKADLVLYDDTTVSAQLKKEIDRVKREARKLKRPAHPLTWLTDAIAKGETDKIVEELKEDIGPVTASTSPAAKRADKSRAIQTVNRTRDARSARANGRNAGRPIVQETEGDRQSEDELVAIIQQQQAASELRGREEQRHKKLSRLAKRQDDLRPAMHGALEESAPNTFRETEDPFCRPAAHPFHGVSSMVDIECTWKPIDDPLTGGTPPEGMRSTSIRKYFASMLSSNHETIHVGDFVELVPGPGTSQPRVAQVLALWKQVGRPKESCLYGRFLRYYRFDETSLNRIGLKSADNQNRVYKTSHVEENVPLAAVLNQCHVEIMSGVDAPTEFQTQHMSDKEALLCSAMYDFETGALAPIE